MARRAMSAGEPFVHFSRLSGSVRPICHLQRDVPSVHGIYMLPETALVHPLC
jgi:hypothetical protein